MLNPTLPQLPQVLKTQINGVKEVIQHKSLCQINIQNTVIHYGLTFFMYLKKEKKTIPD